MSGLAPRCGRPVAPYETPAQILPGKYAGPGAAIRRARLARGLSQAQLAAVIGVTSRKQVSRWETGRAYPRKSADLLEEVLGISLDRPCWRPRGHRGPCRSKAAVMRYLRDDLARQSAARERAAYAA